MGRMTAQSRRMLEGADAYTLHSWKSGRCWLMAWTDGVPAQIQCADGPMLYDNHAAAIRAASRVSDAPLLRVEWLDGA